MDYAKVLEQFISFMISQGEHQLSHHGKLII